MINVGFQNRIIKAMQEHRNNYESNKQQAIVLGVNDSQLSRIYNGDVDNVLSDKKWFLIANKLGVHMNPERDEWKVARTKVFNAIYTQLETCQDQSISAILCDNADIGKTFTAKVYTKEHRNCFYIDCSQAKTKKALVENIAREIGIDHYGSTYKILYENVVTCLRSITTPLIILDEAGDLDYSGFLEIKALWNATERSCGWYMMGADALKRKIDRNLEREKVGYWEIFSRFGNKYQKITPLARADQEDFRRTIFTQVAKVNGLDNIKELKQLYAQSNGSIRRVYTEVQKQKKETTKSMQKAG